MFDTLESCFALKKEKYISKENTMLTHYKYLANVLVFESYVVLGVGLKFFYIVT